MYIINNTIFNRSLKKIKIENIAEWGFLFMKYKIIINLPIANHEDLYPEMPIEEILRSIMEK